MTIKSLVLSPADILAHPISATPLKALYVAIWPNNGANGVIVFGDANSQAGVAPYQFAPIVSGGNTQPAYDLSQIYYKLSDAADSLCVIYAAP
jgi:hypothetical protein